MPRCEDPKRDESGGSYSSKAEISVWCASVATKKALGHRYCKICELEEGHTYKNGQRLPQLEDSHEKVPHADYEGDNGASFQVRLSHAQPRKHDSDTMPGARVTATTDELSRCNSNSRIDKQQQHQLQQSSRYRQRQQNKPAQRTTQSPPSPPQLKELGANCRPSTQRNHCVPSSSTANQNDNGEVHRYIGT